MSVHLLLLLSLLAISLSCSGGAALPPVYDADGNELSSRANYYVLPAVHGHGGGLIMASHGSTCPLFVAQAADEHSSTVPVRFKPLQGGATSSTTVRVSTDLRVYFDVLTTCVQTTEWHVVGYGRYRRVSTGPVWDPSPSGREKVFRIEKHGRGYKLVSCRDECQDLGIIRQSNDLWLGASEPALEVVFKKAPSF